MIINDQRPERNIWQRIHLDPVLLSLLSLLMLLGLTTIYSASGEDLALIYRQTARLGIAIFAMLIVAQVPVLAWYRAAPFVYLIGIILLLLVPVFGVTGKGAQRWLDFGVMRFQPSEIIKVFMPITIAWFISQHPLPPKHRHLLIGLALILLPTLLIARQPDLGTSILIASSGLFVLFFAGLSWRLIIAGGLAVTAFIPLLWTYLMKDYQKQRVLTFLDPESDPLGTGYHIIQSKVAIGSGGWQGKGYLLGSQSQLEFLPERHTDFIFSVYSEEFGFVGALILFAIYLLIIMRGLIITVNAQDTFERLLAASITLTFFIYVFVNIGMVSGLLPVVGVPLPLVSYGGTSMVTLMIGFGILMAIHTQPRLFTR